MDVLTDSTEEILSRCISNHNVVELQYLTILFVNYTSVKLGKTHCTQTIWTTLQLFNELHMNKISSLFYILLKPISINLAS